MKKGFATPFSSFFPGHIFFFLAFIRQKQEIYCNLSPFVNRRPAAQALQAAPGALHIPGDDPVHGLIAALDLPPADATGPWLRRARLAALRDARLPLRRIALRRGTVHVSDLRLDVVFPLRAADVRIRRAGFDLDPGFVPWLGRIVHVHYAG